MPRGLLSSACTSCHARGSHVRRRDAARACAVCRAPSSGRRSMAHAQKASEYVACLLTGTARTEEGIRPGGRCRNGGCRRRHDRSRPGLTGHRHGSASGPVPCIRQPVCALVRVQKKRTAKHHVPPCAPCEFLPIWSRPAAGQSGTPARRHPGQRPRFAVRRPAPARQKPEPAKAPWPGHRPGSSCRPRCCS